MYVKIAANDGYLVTNTMSWRLFRDGGEGQVHADGNYIYKSSGI